MPREASDMHLVDDRARNRPPQWSIALPVVAAGVDHYALHCDRIVLPILACHLARISIRHGNSAPVWVEQNLARIETEAVLGCERPSNAVTVELAGTNSGDENVPIVISPVLACLEIDRACGVRLLGIIEQQEFHSACVPGKHAEVDTVGKNGGPQRETSAGARLRRRRVSFGWPLDLDFEFCEIGGHFYYGTISHRLQLELRFQVMAA